MLNLRRPAHEPIGGPAAASNRLLASLAPADLRLLHPMEHVRFGPRYALVNVGDVPRHLYFPASGIVSLLMMDERGGISEVAQIGVEGMIGVSALFGAERARHRAVVQMAADAYRVPLSAARAAFAQSAAFQALALRFADALILELSQNVICKSGHSVEQQFCRRLLFYAERVGSAALDLTHEQIAESLGARRQTITEAARKLQAQRVIAYSRGRISVLDREALLRLACGCYRMVHDAYQEVGAQPTSPPG